MPADMSLPYLSSERTADRNRCTYAQPNIGKRSETLMEALGEGLKVLKWIGTPQEDQQSQLIWSQGGLRDRATKLRVHMIGLRSKPQMDEIYTSISMWVPQQLEWGVVPKAVA